MMPSQSRVQNQRSVTKNGMKGCQIGEGSTAGFRKVGQQPFGGSVSR
jgi:hypothetical protein